MSTNNNRKFQKVKGIIKSVPWSLLYSAIKILLQKLKKS